MQPKTQTGIPRQLTSLWPTLAVTWGPILALLIAAGVQSRVPVSMLMRDPAAVAGVPAYTGALSSIGILLWCATAAVCLFAWAVLAGVNAEPGFRRFLFCAGGLSAVLMADDLLQVHEVSSAILGVPDTSVIAVYVLMIAAFLFAFAKQIRRTDYALLLLALLLFAVSILVDAWDPKALIGDRYHLLEDGPKLLGIATWLGYFGRLCWQLLDARGSSDGSIPGRTSPTWSDR